MIDKLLEKIVSDECCEENIAVLLSGGVDSISMAIAAHRLNKKIHAYTFHLKNNISYDAQKANDICKVMGWKCTTVEVSDENLVQDFHDLRNKWDCIKKTHYECTFPFLYIYPKIEERIVLSGWAADGHYGVSKKACIHYKHTKELFDKFRSQYFDQDNPVGVNQQKLLSNYYQKVFVAPYLNPSIRDFFKQYDWYQLNKPFQKHTVVNAYPEFKNFGKVKEHVNLQLGSGVDKCFEKLLQCKEINFKNRKRMLDVYRDWKKIGKIRTLFD